MAETVARVGDRYRTTESLPVICWWWYDTVAILDDYSDCCDAVLPTNVIFTIDQTAEGDPTRFLCKLDHAKQLKPNLIPKGRQIRLFLGCRPTEYLVEINASQLTESCVAL
jgi:hypothetical protein